MPVLRLAPVALVPLLLAASAAAEARPGGWGGSGWGSSGWGGSGWGSSGWGGSNWGSPRLGDQRVNSGHDSREGKVDADSFVAADAGETLGHGAITIATLPGSTAGAGDGAAYEAALVDQLVKAGYDTTGADTAAGAQRAEIRIVRDVLVPQERKRKPVSGEMTVGTGTHGSMMGMAVAVDLSKPRKALLSTRLEARIVDQASGKPLWEGRATIATREGDARWDEQAIAVRLAAALFERFPHGTSGRVASR